MALSFLCPTWRSRHANKTKGRPPAQGPSTAGLGRLTGSSSLDTLVHAEAVKDSGHPRPLMVIVHDFKPCVEDEMAVSRGQVVRFLFQENDWMYVESTDGDFAGFVPYTYCLPLQKGNEASTGMGHEAPDTTNRATSEGVRSRWSKSLPDISALESDSELVLRGNANPLSSSTPRAQPNGTSLGGTQDPCTLSSNAGICNGSYIQDTEHMYENSYAETIRQAMQNRTPHGTKNTQNNKPTHSLHPTSGSPQGSESHSTAAPGSSFTMSDLGRCIVLYPYWSEAENDLCVERGEFVTLLNEEDPDWAWVAKVGGPGGLGGTRQGFVPSAYLCPANG